MNFKIFQKTYAGIHPRPTVEVEVHKNQQLVTMTVPWGDKRASKLVHETIANYFNSALSDPDSTSPFAKLPGLSAPANSLRIATLLANDSVFQKFNITDYTGGCEFMALNLRKSELSWVHFGQPHILIARQNELHLLQSGLDLGFQFENPVSLPEKLIGITRAIDLETHSTVVRAGDTLVLLVRKTVPRAYFSKNIESEDPEKLIQQLFDLSVDEKNDTPFWIGVLEVGQAV